MKVVLAPGCLQVFLHKQRSDGMRLRRFTDLMHSIDDSIRVEMPAAEKFERSIQDAALIVSPTRLKRLPYDDAELDAIEHFVHRPGCSGHLLILSNHMPHMIQDSRLACRFGFTFSHSTFGGVDRKRNVVLTGTPSEPHWTTQAGTSASRSLRIEIRNCCSILPCSSEGEVLYYLNPDMVDRGDNYPEPRSKIFGYIIDSTADARDEHGRIAALADSGIIGEPMPPNNPGPGLDASDNSEFIRNLVCWLLYGDKPA